MKNRRAYLKSLGVSAGLVLAAGCVEQDAASEDGGTTPSGNGGPTPLSEPPEPVDTALRRIEVGNYEGEIVSKLDTETATVQVGAGVQGLLFEPPVIQVAPGTEVVWEWAGDGGAHNVVAVRPEEAFSSGDPVRGDEETYSKTFEEAGSYVYACWPHYALGMAGAVVVGDGGDIEWQETGEESDGSPDPEYDGAAATANNYLEGNDARAYDGKLLDKTGRDSVTVEVGGGEAGLAFDPLGIRVDGGTEIVWEWTGKGGAHNIVAADESPTEFSSGDVRRSETYTFSQTLDTTGAHRYYCAPHQAVGMHGAIVVD